MTTKEPSNKDIRKIFSKVWNPIGGSKLSKDASKLPKDEYDAYIPVTKAILLLDLPRSAKKVQLINYLVGCESFSMGFSIHFEDKPLKIGSTVLAPPKNIAKTAEKLLRLI